MQLYFKKFSELGEPVVILHGLFGNNGNWASFARDLAEYYQIYGMDLRNHGRSSWSDDHGYSALAEDVLETLDAIGLPQINLIGHSMGGKVAMQLALDHPERIHKLVVVDMAPVTYPKGDDPALQAMLGVDFDRAGSRKEISAAMAKMVQPQAVIDFLLTNLQRGKDGRYFWRCNIAVLAEQLTEIKGWAAQTSAFGGSALFVRGGESDYVLPEYTETINAQFPQAQITTIEGAGHWLHSEKPEAFFEIIQAYFGEK